ncbi:hypothetical protein G9A89_018089 [Geosiphon pyriformis]|nr:hypothetical protein G9A89_018089 [Geosiphon pyriformis]
MREGREQLRFDAKTFHKRARTFLSSWKASLNRGPSDELFKGATAILIAVGDMVDEYPYQKSLAFEAWLLGNEISGVLLLLTPEKIHFVTNENKAALLEDLKQGEKQVPIEIHKRTRDSNHNRKLFEQIAAIVKEISPEKRIGIIPKQRYSGGFIEDWNKVYDEIKTDLVEVDVSSGVASSLAIKDEDELKTIRNASKISSLIMRRVYDTLGTIIDEGKDMTHEKFADEIQIMFEDDKWLEGRISGQDLDFGKLESCYTPIIQSGGNYDLKTSAQSDEGKLHTEIGGIVLCSLGARYKYYCSNIGRTILIQPNKTQEKNYQFLIDLQRHVVDTVKDGTKIRDVYSKAIDFIKNKRPDLEKFFLKTIGFGMGLEFREGNYILSPKNTRELKNGMILNLSLGFQGLVNENPTDEQITNERSAILTDFSKKLDSVSYTFKDETESDQEAKKENKRPAKPTETKKSPPKKSAVLRSKFRSEEQHETPDQRRRQHQRELAAQKQAEGLARFAESDDPQTSQQQAVFQKFESYKRDSSMPKEIKELKIVVDPRNDSIILPIFGLAVPFHISTLKNASKTEEGDYVYLRLNFLTPNQATGKKEDMPFDDSDANFVRAVTYRSTDPYLSEVHKKILDLKKTAAKKEAERKERADIIEQDKLIELRGRRRPQRLPDVFARPGLEGKRAPGELEIHQNGLRYNSSKTNQKIDILFSNVQHLFFQPCDHELIVLLHVHLKNPVMIGKKKTKDIQFYREASDVQFDETGNRKRKYRYGDEDELGAEQEERRRRILLNKEFKLFAEKIFEASDGRFEIDVPYRDLGFNGVPYRTNVLLQPTTECLVHLTDPPFLVITIADIEVAHLERVVYGLKHFDIVFVFKDYSRTPIHINTIPMEQLENVKEWLDSVDVSFTEGPHNLNWGPIMKTIKENPAEFYRIGGWSFLDEDDKEGSGASSESGSEYQQSESEDSESSSDESSYEDDASDDTEVDESDESAPDWDELEEKARRADERKQVAKRKDTSDDERSKKKFRH